MSSTRSRWPIPGVTALAVGVVIGCWASPDAAKSQLMPASFEEVELGMSPERLVDARPDAVPFDVFGEPEAEIAIESYVEIDLSSPFFEQVRYTFARDALCSAQFLRTGREAVSAELLARLLQGAVEKWGEGYTRIAYLEPEIPGLDRERRSNPGLLWKIDGSEILLRYAVHEDVEDTRHEPFADVTIFDRHCLPAPFRGWLSGISPASDAVPEEWFTELEAEVDSPLFN